MIYQKILKQEHNKTRTFPFKTKCTKNTKRQTNIENTKRSFKNTFDNQHSEFTYIHKIAKEISKKSRPLIRSGKSCCIKDTGKFVDKIRNIKLEEDETMISFDISDMYPSLPKQDAITEVVRRIKN